MACRPTLTASARDGRGDPRSGWRKACGAVEQRKGGGRVCAATSCGLFWLLLAEQVELAWIVVTLKRDGFIVATYLGAVVCLELQCELHERPGDVGSGFVGDGEFMRLLGVGMAAE
jgi:hypothetical protein